MAFHICEISEVDLDICRCNKEMKKRVLLILSLGVSINVFFSLFLQTHPVVVIMIVPVTIVNLVVKHLSVDTIPAPS